MSAAELRTVYLHGHLADGIGSSIKLAFNTPSEAVRLLELNFPGFAARFKEGYYRITALRGPQERVLGEQGLSMGFTGDLSFAPALNVSGDGKGVIGTILGAVVIGAAFFFSGGTLAAALPGFLGSTTGFGLGMTYGTIAQMGVGMVLSGVAQMLTPTPETDYSDVDERASFVFNGPVNLTQPGGVVPLIYGAMYVGTYNVSASIDTEMLLSDGAQKVVDTEIGVPAGGRLVYLDMDDLLKLPTGAVLNTVAGVDVTGGATFTVNDLVQLTVTPAAVEDTIGLQFVGDTSNAARLTVAYTATYKGESYEGEFVARAGNVRGALAPSFNAYSTTTEVSGY